MKKILTTMVTDFSKFSITKKLPVAKYSPKNVNFLSGFTVWQTAAQNLDITRYLHFSAEKCDVKI